jgi:hypothetical protein
VRDVVRVAVFAAAVFGCSDGAQVASPLPDVTTAADAVATDVPVTDVPATDVPATDAVGVDGGRVDAGPADAGCVGGAVLCGDRCVSLRSDNEHCGACGMRCRAGTMCSEGVCGVTCGGGLMACNGACKDLQNDGQHCGACNTACPEGQRCNGGMCNCGGTRRPCDVRGATVCIDLETDGQHCGACGNACPGGQRCEAGRCVTTCGGGLLLCGDRCTDPRYDPENCGTCGRACPTAPNRSTVCVNTACSLGLCADGFADCDNNPVNGCEAALARDATNCGRCGFACPEGRFGTVSCTPGGCAIACQAGYANCDGSVANGCEVDTNNDPSHCGGCGVRCPSGQGCQRGVCRAGGLCSVLASIQCVAWGGRVAETSPGSGRIICTTGGRGGADLCNASCDNYRIYAWRAGARPLVCSTANANTIAGGIYTGPVTCGCEQPLRNCGSWDISGCVAD